MIETIFDLPKDIVEDILRRCVQKMPMYPNSYARVYQKRIGPIRLVCKAWSKLTVLEPSALIVSIIKLNLNKNNYQSCYDEPYPSPSFLEHRADSDRIFDSRLIIYDELGSDTSYQLSTEKGSPVTAVL